MLPPAQPTSQSIDYAEPLPPRRLKRTLWAVSIVPLIYISAYFVFRVSGVYYAYWSQGSWEIEGGTGITAVDILFFPACLAEGAVLNNLHLLKVPSGG